MEFTFCDLSRNLVSKTFCAPEEVLCASKNVKGLLREFLGLVAEDEVAQHVSIVFHYSVSLACVTTHGSEC